MYQKAPKPRYNTLAAALLLTALYMFQPHATKAQVGIGTETPHPSAILDLVSTDKGLLISRVELRDLRDSRPIAEPVDGMLVWNTNRDLGIGFYFWSVADNTWYSLFSRQEYNQEASSGITSDNITFWNQAYSHSSSTTGNIHGASTVGSNIYRLTSPNDIRYLRINANNSVTALSAADFRSDIGAGTSDLTLGETTTTAYRGDQGKTAYDHSQLSTGAVHGSTTVGGSLFRLTNPGIVSFLRVNADNSVTARSSADFRTDIGAENITNKKTSLADDSDEFYPTQKAVKTALEEQNALLLAQITELQIQAGIRVQDVDGNIYKIVTIGSQIWMAENLKTTKYNDGTPIAYPGTDNAAWTANTNGAFAWYNNDEATNKDTYGALYNWYAISSTTNGGKNICATGWHVPTDGEWTQLVNLVVSQGNPNTNTDPNGAGNALKSCRQVSAPAGGECATAEHPRWDANATHQGLNTLGFFATPGGLRGNDGLFTDIGINGVWWSSSPLTSESAWYRAMGYNAGNVARLFGAENRGFSVRCVKDATPTPPATFTLTLQASPSGGGTVTGAGNYQVGAEITITATVNSNYAFVGWTNTLGNLVSMASSCTLYMPEENTTLTANYVGIVTNPTTGKIWMDRNLGASRVATSSTDAQAYGVLYQWGRATDGHQIRTSSITTTLSNSDTPGHGRFITTTSSPIDWRSPQNNNLWQGATGTNNPCPAGFRLPTDAEWNQERLSWSSNNAAGAFASPLKLPVAGYRNYSNGSLNDVGSFGIYWSSTVAGFSSRYLNFSSSTALMAPYYHAYGFSVRCIKDY